jgi:hypothetical protein
VGGSGGPDAKANRPPPDLRQYASERSLEWMDRTPVHGIYCVDQFFERFRNMSYGPLPGGEAGALCHEKVVTRHSTADGGGGQHAPNTRVATRVPEAIAPLQRLWLARISKLETRYLARDPDELNPQADATALGLSAPGSWALTMAAGADQNFVRQLLSGDFGARLAAVPGEFLLEFDYGSLVLVNGEDYLEGAELDALSQHLCGLAQALRAAASAAADPQPFDSPLPRPSWESTPPPQEKKKKFLGITFTVASKTHKLATDGIGGLGEMLLDPWYTTVTQLAEAKGGELEDALAYHRAFPKVPMPGRAFGVIRMEDGGRIRRIALHAEGSTIQGVGVVQRVRDDVESRPIPVSWDPSNIGVAVDAGLMATWTHAKADAPTDTAALAQQADEIAQREGWL